MLLEAETRSVSKKTRNGLLLAALVVLVLGLILGGIIGHFATKSPAGGTWSKLTAEADRTVSKKILSEIKAENIRKYLSDLTKQTHLAGTPADLGQAEELKTFWKAAGLDPVNIIPYNVLLSIPDKDNPNKIVLLNENDEAVFTSQLVEKVLRPEQNQSDVVPPFNAYSSPGTPKGDLIYVNYGRMQDFTWLKEEKGVDFTGKICIARYGKIFRGNKANLAEYFGCIGLILYSDPSDYAASSSSSGAPYPASWWLPPTGVQRGNVKMSSGGLGDPSSPGYPGIESAYRIYENETSLPTIPVHPISYGDAEEFLKQLSGEEAPEEWRGALPITYRLGPGLVNNGKIQMFISTHNVMRDTYNVMGIIRGSVEPDRYVMLGNHRDAWVFGAVDPSSGTAAMMEVARAMGKAYQEGWRPRRSIVFCSWAAEEYGILGSREWVEHYGKILGDRAVAYLNVDIAVQGNFTLRGRAMPMLFNVMRESAKHVDNPSTTEIAKGRTTVYDTWAANYPEKDSTGQATGRPKLPILGSGSDFAPFVGKVGVTCADIRYHYDDSLGISSYPLYHSVYETFHLVDTYMDPGFKLHAAVSQYWAELARNLADSYLLPFNVVDYAGAISDYVDRVEESFGELIRANGLGTSLAFLRDASEQFTKACEQFQNSLEDVNYENPIEVRRFNDQMMDLERAFIDPLGLPDRPLTRNVVFAPSKHNSYAGSSFPGITDAMFEIEKKSGVEKQEQWRLVHKQLATVTFFIETAAASLHPATDYMKPAEYNPN
ncbi:hypothetical protein CAPTEDRAFT_160163 [Capitella teleta]|uniref:Glutamate carboxypeptidase 2 n=1 Tax=Capitella teleta TaxID=283909 RepID=R7UTN8_CAPTE|nr:hypothetical protein CAPTEDRAFT_160163 [Capitella teleta]|eukprot:ELU09884.1 hypothetical protein CAPTEDRAFT_160163 [Capitella teleta]